jgi:hypothetical protein
MRNVSDKFTDKIEAHFMCKTFFSKNRAVYEIMWKNMILARQAAYDNMAPARCMLIPTATNTLKIRTFIAFPLQQRLGERA